jgi:hypothetical protein
MKNIATVSLVCFVLIFCGCTSTKGFVKNPSRLRQINRIAILPFICNKEEFGYNIAESISACLLSSRLTIIERSQLQLLLNEQNLTIDGIVRGDQSFVGKLQGVDALIMGSATASRGFAGMAYGGNIDYISNCTARIVDVTTGEVLSAASFSSEGASTMSGVTTATEVGEKLAKKLASEL